MEETIKCNTCHQEKSRSEFRRVKSPEMCLACIQKRKDARRNMEKKKQHQNRSDEHGVRNTIYLAPRQQAILNVLSISNTRSGVVQSALELLFENQPGHVKEFFRHHQEEIKLEMSEGQANVESEEV
ncbi:hypothetical protein [Evansella tamaricis]|uniref:Uncharacterized protein n=1 Tax=Evansella tamaricis TaxID=2069301 RepID=A0ABS6JEV3_9BACI|nr:hypothetical protein [Evansella tamaricis]MBU9711367.1 hypothetical protein [Evansella tamaricis]